MKRQVVITLARSSSVYKTPQINVGEAKARLLILEFAFTLILYQTVHCVVWHLIRC